MLFAKDKIVNDEVLNIQVYEKAYQGGYKYHWYTQIQDGKIICNIYLNSSCSDGMDDFGGRVLPFEKW